VLANRGEGYSTHPGQDHQTDHLSRPGRPDSAPPRTFRFPRLLPEIAQNHAGSTFASGLDPCLNPFSGLGQQRLGLILCVHDRLGRCGGDRSACAFTWRSSLASALSSRILLRTAAARSGSVGPSRTPVSRAIAAMSCSRSIRGRARAGRGSAATPAGAVAWRSRKTRSTDRLRRTSGPASACPRGSPRRYRDCLRTARTSQANRSASKKPRVECDRCLWPYRDSCSVWVVRIYHNVSVAAGSDD
jgi:hypothetical protein